jgi:hypothetical protein
LRLDCVGRPLCFCHLDNSCFWVPLKGTPIWQREQLL